MGLKGDKKANKRIVLSFSVKSSKDICMLVVSDSLITQGKGSNMKVTYCTTVK